MLAVPGCGRGGVRGGVRGGGEAFTHHAQDGAAPRVEIGSDKSLLSVISNIN